LFYAIVSAERPAPLDSDAQSIPLAADMEVLVLAYSSFSERHLRSEEMSGKDQGLGAFMLVRTRAGEWILAPIWGPATLAGMPSAGMPLAGVPSARKPLRRTQASKGRFSVRMRMLQWKKRAKSGWHWSLGRVQRSGLHFRSLEESVPNDLSLAHLTSSTSLPSFNLTCQLPTCHCL
jgi:hypothetical protein